MATETGILRSLVQIRLGGLIFDFVVASWNDQSLFLSWKAGDKIVSEVGFEPTPTFVDQNAPLVSKEETVLLSLAP